MTVTRELQNALKKHGKTLMQIINEHIVEDEKEQALLGKKKWRHF
ncbi:hypothetical protein [Pseudobacillus badius]|nr:hypothetical protein [Bacillus badius]KIL73872.1 hypothetical protein SD78_2930 [Bacillus badius]MED0668078.1 hypothetical protein [Bacillus badius]GLY11958.1 hypothetical protein Bbad01_31740 [Bacillus badius]